MRDFAERLYKSKEWTRARMAYLTEKNFICERCGGVAVICHHKEYVTPDNIGNVDITLNPSNFEALCRACHKEEHYCGNYKDYRHTMTFDENGNPVEIKRHVIITGAPGSGKTTYVMNQKDSEDIMIDLDFIGCALCGYDRIHDNRKDIVPLLLDIREAIYDSLSRNTSNYKKAYIITTENNEMELSRLAGYLNAEIVMIEATPEECKERIKNDKTRTNKARQYKLVDKWFESPPILQK